MGLKFFASGYSAEIPDETEESDFIVGPHNPYLVQEQKLAELAARKFVVKRFTDMGRVIVEAVKEKNELSMLEGLRTE